MYYLGSRAGLLRVAAVEIPDNFFYVFQVVCRHFGGLIVSSPLYGILKTGVTSSATAILTGVENIFNFKLFYSIDFH